MSAHAQLIAQRSFGRVDLRLERDGIEVLREEGSSKCRIPKYSSEAVLINTSGGLAGGDRIEIKVEAAEGATLTLTTQAAERVYRSLEPYAEVSVSLSAGKGSNLFWLPHETILFEGSKLRRSLEVDLAENAQFIAVESLTFGRHEMGENCKTVSVEDHWLIRRGGKLIHAEALSIGPHLPSSAATLGGAKAVATMIIVSPTVSQFANILGNQDGFSSWNGKTVVRFLAADGFSLRKKLMQLLSAVMGAQGPPKCWTF